MFSRFSNYKGLKLEKKSKVWVGGQLNRLGRIKVWKFVKEKKKINSFEELKQYGIWINFSVSVNCLPFTKKTVIIDVKFVWKNTFLAEGTESI